MTPPAPRVERTRWRFWRPRLGKNGLSDESRLGSHARFQSVLALFAFASTSRFVFSPAFASYCAIS
jgi:hypothetical protein